MKKIIERNIAEMLVLIVVVFVLSSCATSKSDMKCAFGVYCNVEVEQELEKRN